MPTERPRVYIVKPAIVAPALLSVACVVAAVDHSWWDLVALPFIWLGSICAQPNLNLANGCLAYVAMMFGFGLILIPSTRLIGDVIAFGAMSGFVLSAVPLLHLFVAFIARQG